METETDFQVQRDELIAALHDFAEPATRPSAWALLCALALVLAALATLPGGAK